MRIRESDQKYKDNTFGAPEHRREAPLTEQQQQACVSASATVGVLLPHICRRNERHAPVAEMDEAQLKEHVAASSRSLPIALTQRSRPLPPPAGTARNARSSPRCQRPTA